MRVLTPTDLQCTKTKSMSEIIFFMIIFFFNKIKRQRLNRQLPVCFLRRDKLSSFRP